MQLFEKKRKSFFWKQKEKYKMVLVGFLEKLF